MSSRGFTLVELLVALVVVALTGITVSSAVGNIVSQTYILERRAVAHWVAENQLARTQLSRVDNVEPVATGRRTERVVMSGRTWRVDEEISQTTHPWLRRVEIEVYEVVDDDVVGPLDRLVGFIGRY
ncbi:MAG: type II secretion system minor pseudopilin GspI [Gammaproteobacteria bacterium]|nr:type II secretion system minor pseudopilin GspI [Gammaproteobacteria bacterium]